MDKDTSKSTFIQLLKPIYNGKFLEQAKILEVDKYTKKLTVEKLLILLVYAQLEQHKSLRQIAGSLNNADLGKTLDLNLISASQISRKARDLPPQLIQLLFQDIIRQFGIESGFKNIQQQLGNLYLIDSSTISLCLSKYQWAVFRKTKGGVKLHLRIRMYEQGVLPDLAVIKPAKPADKTQMDALVAEGNNALNVFDRAYVDYKKFDHYCEKGIRFVSRLKSNALVEVIEQYHLSPESVIKKDQKVYLGKDGITKMKHPLRLVETEDSEGKPVIIVTNDFTLSSEEISDIYRYRWQIELFFKWIKQHLHVKHFYSLSQQAVENQLYIALITYCLMMLLKLKTGYKESLLNVKRLLTTCLFEPFTSFVQKLYRKSGRKSKGRRRIDYERIYQETERQVMAGEADHIDDLTYDPLIP